ncbi:BTB/POZ domain-containing protein At2g13690 [Ricinus communis]|uniref:Transcription regulator, putative n=1 Tax=Ricinus communis TaxID=3988 RepID=B9SKW7_RICCO|nr:BTB/POZ domain-containing protein At2g13690 [Ricinus communis]EEF35748.1 transcription regulator, putative [Ricinus communis]|eukprot:XP_002526636.1 BTB/POZ domain-containing protein At2g13690 [Ricinus communis]
MADSARRKPSSQARKLSWCCSLTGYPPSPENPVILAKAIHKKTDSVYKLSSNSVPNSPLNTKSGLNFVGRIDPRRILSPGRVSPIDSDPAAGSFQEIVTELSHSDPVVQSAPKSRSESFRVKNDGSLSHLGSGSEPCGGVCDVRLNLKGKRGGGLVLETSSEVLIANSEVFCGLISEYRNGLGSKSNSNNNNNSSSTSCKDSLKMCRIEVPDLENLGVFRDTIELMFEEDITKRLLKIGVYRAIDILEVSVGIKFNKGVLSCLKFLEAVPWTEEEEEKLRGLFAVFKFEEAASQDILARLCLNSSADSKQNLARQLVWSITTCTDTNARNELKSLVKGLLCKSSIYEKDQPELDKRDLYVVCQSCLGSLLTLLEEGCYTSPNGRVAKRETGKPLIERISRQVDNINWLLEILIDRQMGEEFVDMWADQGELLKLHESASPMVRYELSRVSATLFIAMGARKLHCRAEARAGLLQAWFDPMLSDFGWLQRCKKGLDTKALEEALGQTLLTLPLKQQYMLFMEWFRCFSKHGTECPNLSKAFQIWWRRSFLRGSESYAIESR